MQQAGGSQFGVPPPPPTSNMTPFSAPSAGLGGQMLGIPPSSSLQQQFATETASPIGNRPGSSVVPQQPGPSFEDLVPAVVGGFTEDDAIASGEAGGSGNRWPRQETLALLKIRSEMDTAFREATLKGPLWDEVARKLGDLGYKRSGKKCKEKFENVHKYYKRTKEGRAGRQDGKSYRFFTQLEALHSGSGAATAVSASPISFSTPRMASPISAAAPQAQFSDGHQVCSAGLQAVAAAAAAGISFSSNSSESEDEENGEEERDGESGKGEGASRKMMAFFDGLMKQVMERQEAMQKRFLETIEKREQDRMIREEAWRRQEMARLGHEQELLAKERAMAASRDAALISYLQKISGGQFVPPPPITPTTFFRHTSPPQQQQVSSPAVVQPLQQQPPAPPPPPFTHRHEARQQSMEIIAVSEQNDGAGGFSFESASSSRWPKAEVHALIDLRSSLDSRYQEAGPKGPLWDEISAGMQKLGYNRNAKRCKEKWENINKYFKKVKESKKRRPEDAKTCPYFHQLDALYRKKQLVIQQHQETQTNPNPNLTSQTPAPAQQHQAETDAKNASKSSEIVVPVPTSNCGVAPSFFEQGMKKPEDIVKEMMGQRQQQPVAMDNFEKINESDSDDMEQDFSDEDDDEEDEDNMQYKIQYQRPNVSGNGGSNSSTAAATANAGSFLAIVQ